MTEPYDCTKDVTEHIERVRYWLRGFARVLEGRAERHDESKLQEPEKSMFDEYTPLLKVYDVSSREYKQVLHDMGTALQHHYLKNRHHPEHYANGVDGMTLHDVVEMVCDWMAACQAKNVPVDLKHLSERFKISPQLTQVIANTLKEEDYWNAVNGVPVGNFYQEK